jgi:hypothetical protein
MERAAPLTDRRGRSGSRHYGSEQLAEEWSQDRDEDGRRHFTCRLTGVPGLALRVPVGGLCQFPADSLRKVVLGPRRYNIGIRSGN